MPTRTIHTTIDVCALTGRPIAGCSCSWYPRGAVSPGAVSRGWNHCWGWRYNDPPGRNDDAGALIGVGPIPADQLGGIRSNSSQCW